MVPSVSVVSVEHPCIVKNVDKAINMLGGGEAIAETLEAGNEKTLSLSFTPEDLTARKISSFNNSTNNVLVKITVPKRTGRKRKRGSDEPSAHSDGDAGIARDASYLLRSMKDNPTRCKVEPIGNIESTHVWRAMPDFVYSTQSSTFLQEIRTKVLPQEYPLLKQWRLPRTYGLSDTETFPPPVLSNHSLAHNYTYRQNPAVKAVADPATGQKKLHNTQEPVKTYTHQCKDNDLEYPTSPPAECPDISQQPATVQRLYEVIRDLFEERPIWTRRALINRLPDDAPVFFARYAIAYVAFAIRSGPWRDALCKFGVDPRKDPAYRKYQTVLLQLISSRDKETLKEFARIWHRSRDKQSHIFDGTRLPSDGKVWQLCDLEDPQLKPLVDIPDIYVRSQCETRYFGWYPNGTSSKIRVALKAKVDSLTDAEPLDESALARFLQLPDVWDGETRFENNITDDDPVAGYLPKGAGKKELEWASAYRALCRTREGTIPLSGASGKGRLSKSKPVTRPSFVDPNLESHANGLQGDQPIEEDPASYGEPDEADDDEAAADAAEQADGGKR